MADIFTDILLPLPLNEKFTYIVPDQLKDEVEPGKRVVIPFGNRKQYAALIISVYQERPTDIQPKEIISVIDEYPIINHECFKLWEWVAEYYCCTPGDVMNAALPAGLKMESQTKFTALFLQGWEHLPQKEHDLLLELKGKTLTLNEIQKSAGRTFNFKILKNLQEKGFLKVSEELTSGYLPKMQDFVTINPSIKNKEDLELAFAKLSRAKKQLDLLNHFINLSGEFIKSEGKFIPKTELFHETLFNYNDLKGLIKKNILVAVKKNVSRVESEYAEQAEINILNPWQQIALKQIKELFTTKNVILLHGVTASGKTEIYIHLIQEIIEKGRQVLYLVPEIAITTQIIRRLRKAFGKKVGIYHSKLNDNERVEIWGKTNSFQRKTAESCQIILGARSAALLPFSDLGLVIVDEEHENSFKQFDPAPRYNARDLAIFLASMKNAKTILGSASPSFESLVNARTGKYGFVEIGKRHTEVELPEVHIADLQIAYKKRQMKSLFTPEMYDRIDEALKNSSQVILFQNRRGYSPFVECMDCGWIPKCRSCDVSLTWHRQKGKLICHYCGYSHNYPDSCSSCQSREVKTRGFGTEKIETEIRKFFKNARVARMDLDTTHSKTAYEKIISNLEKGKTDILVGTQMITKGLDFGNVSLVGILNADNLINFPDFRAHERAYQLLSQVSGRAGRREKQGNVVIQTTQPGHPVIRAVKEKDFESFFAAELTDRKMFNYPPFSRLIKIIVKHKNQEKATRIADQVAGMLANETKITVLGPESPLIGRVQLWHIKEIWLKLPRSHDLPELKKFIRDSVETVRKLPDNSGSFIHADVDPM